MAKLATLPFGRDQKTSSFEPQRRQSRNEATSTEITKKELLQALKGDSVEDGVQQKFQDYINSASPAYLEDSSVRKALSEYLKNSVESGGAEANKLFNADSGLSNYLEKKTRAGSLERALFSYIQDALKAKESGKDLESEPLSIAGNKDLLDGLKDPDKGISIRSVQLDRIRKNSDPLVAALYTAANRLGLRNSVDKTRDDLLQGVNSDYTKQLGADLDSLLKKDQADLNEVLADDGSLAYERKNGKFETISPLYKSALDDANLGDLKDTLFANIEDEFSFGDFFKKAQTLSVKGNEEKLEKHVSDGLGFIFANYKARFQAADTDAKNAIKEEFDHVVDAIQGRGYVPERLSSIIKDKAASVILSKDFQRQVSAGDEEKITDMLIKDFAEDLEDSEIKRYEHLDSLNKAADGKTILADGKINIINPDSYETSEKKIKHVLNDQISTSEEAKANRDLNGESVTLERAVQVYDKVVSKASDDVLTAVSEKLADKKGSVNIDKLNSTRVESQKSLADRTFTSLNDVKAELVKQVNMYIDGKVQTNDSENLEKTLKSLVENDILNADRNTKKTLWTDNNGQKTELSNIVVKISMDLINGRKDDDATVKNIDSLFEALKEKEPNEDKILSKFTDRKGEARINKFLEAIRANEEDAFDMSKYLDLNKISEVFDGTKGKELRTALEELSIDGSSYDKILEDTDSNMNGEFPTLLFAKTKQGSADQARRTAALVQLIEKAAGGPNASDDKLNSISMHIVDKLRGNEVNKNEVEILAGKLKDAVKESKIKHDNKDKSLSEFVTDVVVKSQQRFIGLTEFYQNMGRRIVQSRGQFVASALTSFADKTQVAKAKETLERVQSTVDSADKSANNADQLVLEQLSSDEEAQNMFVKVKEGLTQNPLAFQDYESEHPGDVLDKLGSFLHSVLFNKVLALFRPNSSTEA